MYAFNTFVGIMDVVMWTVFPGKRSMMYLLSILIMLLSVHLGVRHYAVRAKLEFNVEKAVIMVGTPLFATTLVLSLLDTEFSGDLILPSILMFFWGCSVNFTNYLILEGRKRYAEINNYTYGSQVIYIDVFVNIYEAFLLYFQKFEDEDIDIKVKLDQLAVF